MSNHQLRDTRADEILARLRWRVRLDELLLERGGGGGDTAELMDQLRSLSAHLDGDLASNASQIGTAPAVRSSLRGEIGHFGIGILRRLLWWYTSSLENFAYSLRRHMQGTTEALATMTSMLLANQREIARLREEVRVLRERRFDDLGQAG